MPLTAKDLLNGFVLPAAVATLLLYVLRRYLPPALGTRYPATMAALAGFFVGYALLGLAPWQPAAHWQWLPYAVLAAAGVGPVSLAAGVRTPERWLLYVLMAMVGGWCLVPSWDDLEPARGVYLVAFVGGVFLIAALLEPLTERLPGPLLPVLLSVTMICGGVVLLLSGSLRFAQIAGIGAGALAGCSLAGWTDKKANLLAGVAPLYGMLSSGLMLVGRVNSYSDVPWAAYFLVPVAPLALWADSCGPLRQLTGIKRFAVRVGLVVLPLAIVVALAIAADSGAGDEY